ncbi:MAG: ATP-dependent helicase [Terriglobia bacterium]
MLELNPEQQKAVEHGEGPLLVVAGPGTGKTRVITRRILHLIEHGPGGGDPTPPRQILALTFTGKAAQEMKRRVAEALPALESPPFISTFHAFCLHILRRRHVDRLLLDKTDVWIFLRRRMEELGLEFYQKLAEPGAFLHDLNEFFSRCQDELIDPGGFEHYVRAREQHFSARFPHFAPAAASPEETLARQELLRLRELARIFHNSRRLIEEAGASSLGSLVSETVALWDRFPGALEQVRGGFRAVLVDEFQDTNYAQVELLKRLIAPPYFITAVGDDDQAIYRFRGASHGAFEMFHQAFPGHATVYLNRNYRSTQKILRAAEVVIAQNTRHASKPALVTQGEEGRPVYLLKSPDALSEALWIACEIERLAGKGFSYGGIAVLYRAHNNRDLLVEEFRRRSVPFAVRGLSLLSTTVLRDLTAWLKIIASPHDNISLTRALLAPRWRFPEDLAQQVRARAAKDRCSLYDVLKNDRSAAFSGQLAATGWRDIEKLLGSLRRSAAVVSVTALINRLLEQLGWRYLPGSPELAYLEAFTKFVEGWEQKSETRRLAEFIEYFDYFVEAGGKIEAAEAAEPSNAVQMMTVHAAKGLEFPVVFVIGVSARRFPSMERKPVIEFPDDLRKGPLPPANIHVQEERRLFFVALTRARERLYVSSFAKTPRQQSIFIDNLLADPIVSARDIEVIEVPGASPGKSSRSALHAARPRSAETGTKVLLSETARGAAQGRLFAETRESGASHPDIEGWAEKPAAFSLEEKLRMSPTAAEDYRGCPLRYKFHHILKIPAGPQAALSFGNLMHQSVRRYFEIRRRSLPSFEEIERFYASRWKSAGFDDSYQEETYRKAGIEQLRAFVESRNVEALDGGKIQMELNFKIGLDDLEIEGRIDQVRLLDPVEDRLVEITDYKTGRPRTQKDADKSLQLSVYALAAQRALGLKPGRLAFYNLTNNEAVFTTRTPEDLEEAVGVIRGAAAEIRSGQFPPKPGFICRWCDYQPLCPAHED